MSRSFPNLTVIDHPLIQHKLAILRDKKTPKKEFKELVHEITLLLAYEATSHLKMTRRTIETPLEICEANVLAGKKPVILPILRAGIGMVDAFLTLMPAARVGHVGMFRDEKTHLPHRYYFKIPPNGSERQFFICDPMLATGHTAVSTIDELKKNGITKMIFVCLVASPQSIQLLLERHPDVPIYAASLDRELNKDAYILPGLGDAGDRLFGTR